MEQFALGGPDSVRAYPISDALGDHGYHVAVEYQVDAPGFGDKASPFGGRPWREVVQFELFADHGRVSSVGSAGSPGRTFDGAGAGLRFNLPDTNGLVFRERTGGGEGKKGIGSDEQVGRRSIKKKT